MSDDKRYDEISADDRALLARIRETLDADAAGLDAATASRLNRARQAALDVHAQPRLKTAWLGAGAMAAAAAVFAFALVVRAPETTRLPVGEAAAAQDLDLLSGEEIDLYEDQEFYAWLDAQSPSSG